MTIRNHSSLLAGLLIIALGGCANSTTERATSTNGSGDAIGTDSTSSSRTPGVDSNSSMTGSTSSQAGTGTTGTTGTTSGSGTGMPDTSGTGSSTSTSTAGQTGDTTSSTQSTATTSGTGSTTGTTQSSGMRSYGVVQSIDRIARQDVGVGTVGGAAVGGSMGGMVYRITMRMDDGTMQSVVQESTPNFQNGDRVQMVNGVVSKY